jgi:GrpB-like predicted nucleotidyltransferase (UPF0157 family)
VEEGRSLDARLAAAGVEPGTDPVTAWGRLRDVEGRRVTVIELYEMVAAPRGLASHELPHAERAALARSVMPFVWPGFAITEASDRSGDTIRVVDYDPEWPLRYERWQARLRSLLGDTARRIEHVGSTSVPGLPAKPIIDIQLSVDDVGAEASYVPQLEQAGVQLRSRDDVHLYFRPYAGLPRDVHIHVCGTGSDWEREHLLFRDYLRTHDGARRRYAAAKREAARMWSDDGWAYTDAKSEVILAILADAGG